METLVFELSIILVTTATLCTVAELTKQPLVPAYIVAGLILGQKGLGIIESNAFFSTISEVGILLLLYLIGLELKPKYFLKTFKKSALITIASALVTAGFGYAIFLFTSFDAVKIFYLTVALFFSSTVVVMRTLEESKKISQDVYDGCLGILLTQDIIAVLILIALNSQQISGNFEVFGLVQFVFYGVGIIFLSWFLQKWLLRIIIKKIYHRSDVIFLIGLAWCFFFAELAEVLHLSREIGAFIAGLSITSLPERKQKLFVEKSETIRDFFMVLFFFMLGANFKIENFAAALPISLLGVLFVITIKPMIFYLVSKKVEYSETVSREIGLRLGQISEFSIIVAAFGFKIGQLSKESLNIIHLIFFLTIIISGYLVRYVLPKLNREES